MNNVIRVTAILIWTVLIYGFVGGSFVYRQNLPSGLYNLYTITMYKTLPLPPKGPSYCNFLTIESYGLALPCDLKPPFIGWLQGGRF
jgi:hypothetical protein